MIDVDWVYREFLRRGYTQEYASEFIDAAWSNSSKPLTEESREHSEDGGMN